MIVVFIKREDSEYLFDGIWAKIHEKSNRFLKAWATFIDLSIDRHFIIFSDAKSEPNIEHLQFSQLKRNGKIHIKFDTLENNLDLAENQRCVIFNSNDSQTNKKKSSIDNCIHSNIQDDNQFIDCIEDLFETKISPIQSFSKNNLVDFPYLNLPVRTLVFYDPYFPKINSSTSKIDVSKIVNSLEIFLTKLISKVKVPNSKSGIDFILVIKEGKDSNGRFFSPIGAVAYNGNLKDLEDKTNQRIAHLNTNLTIVLGNKDLHDRGFYSEYFQIINTNSIHDRSAALVFSGILRDSFGYFSNLDTLNSTCNNKLVHLTNRHTILNLLNLI